MKHVKVLGTGCSGCKTTIRLIQQGLMREASLFSLKKWSHCLK